MNSTSFKNELLAIQRQNNTLFKKELFEDTRIKIYPMSINETDDVVFFIARDNNEKYLFVLFEDKDDKIAAKFEGNLIIFNGSNKFFLKKCPQNTYNRKMLQGCFEFTNPKVFGLLNSFGFGDRLGFANPAHLRSLIESNFKPVLAQQSIRELTRTNRTPSEVMDAAVWAVFQEGYTEGFGADADHLKKKEDIDLMVKNGFKMFTFDPSEYVHNEADTLVDDLLDDRLKSINWKELRTEYENLVETYLNKEFRISDDLIISAGENQLKRALIKYGDALVYIKKMYYHLTKKHPDYESEAEVSVDETESVTSPFEHFFIASELQRLGIKLNSLAPRFVGAFEKGIDYKGDLDLFKQEYIKHASIANYFGTYKLSLHSGSDKFSVYKVIGSLKIGSTHVKTAGTSYLEALKVIGMKEPALFREILDYSAKYYETEKLSYHVSADLSKLKSISEYKDEELIGLFNDNNVRQILHVAFGRVLSDKDENKKYIFKERLLNCLRDNEELHYKLIIDHFRKHLEPFD
jgi:hypothetical protein